MPKKFIGLMGYVGEAVVEQWLRMKYPPTQGYAIHYQIVPMAVTRKGGPYLDFGVTKDGVLQAIYEVKSQDYIPAKDFALNVSLTYLWSKASDWGRFRTQDGDTFDSDNSLRAYMVLLVGPNSDGIARIGNANVRNIILFTDIWRELRDTLDMRHMIESMIPDIEAAIRVLKNPTQGRIVTEQFLKLRDGMG